MTKELLFFCTLAAGDYFSTQAGIGQGLYEANPIMRGGANKQAILKSSSCIAEAFVVSRFKKKKVLYVVGGIVGAGIIANNLIQINK